MQLIGSRTILPPTPLKTPYAWTLGVWNIGQKGIKRPVRRLYEVSESVLRLNTLNCILVAFSIFRKLKFMPYLSVILFQSNYCKCGSINKRPAVRSNKHKMGLLHLIVFRKITQENSIADNTTVKIILRWMSFFVFSHIFKMTVEIVLYDTVVAFLFLDMRLQWWNWGVATPLFIFIAIDRYHCRYY